MNFNLKKLLDREFDQNDQHHGFEYFQNQKVSNFKVSKNNRSPNSRVLTAVVSGSKPYEVMIQIKRSAQAQDYLIENMKCTCPSFAMNQRCKHLVATLTTFNETNQGKKIAASTLKGTNFKDLNYDNEISKLDHGTSTSLPSTQLYLKLSGSKEVPISGSRFLISVFSAKVGKEEIGSLQSARFNLNEWTQITQQKENEVLLPFFETVASFVDSQVGFTASASSTSRSEVQFYLTEKQAMDWLPKLTHTGRLLYSNSLNPLNWNPEKITSVVHFSEGPTAWNAVKSTDLADGAKPLEHIGSYLIYNLDQIVTISPHQTSALYDFFYKDPTRENVYIEKTDLEMFIQYALKFKWMNLAQIEETFHCEVIKTHQKFHVEITEVFSDAYRLTISLPPDQLPDKKENQFILNESEIILDTFKKEARKRVGADLSTAHQRPVEIYQNIGKIVELAFSLNIPIQFNGLPIKNARPLSFEISSTDEDWFDVTLSENLTLPELEAAARTQEKFFLTKKGLFIEVTAENKKALKALIGILDKKSTRKLRIDEENKFLLYSFLDEDQYLSKELRISLLEEIEALNSIKANPQSNPKPKALKADLRHYQEEGFNFIVKAFEHNLNPCLADEMGLGKTVQTIAAILAFKPKRVLIACPKSLTWNWQEEFKKFAPTLETHIYGKDFSRRELSSSFSGILIVSTPLLRIDFESFQEHFFDLVVIDEAQVIKNPTALISKCIFALKSQHRLALTGTPIENGISDLLSIFHFLNPKLVTHSLATRFQRHKEISMYEPIKKLTNPLILRRTKDQVLSELPEKTINEVLVELDPKEQTTYEDMKNSIVASLTDQFEKIGFNNSKLHILEGILRLRQLSCHPRLVFPEQVARSSSKFDTAIELIQDVLPEKVVVFSAFTKLLDLFEYVLKDKHITFTRLDGKTKDRQEVVNNFSLYDGPSVLLASLKAGGIGLNLTQASYAIILDPWWNAAAELQAQDRLHRIGQTKPVFIYKLISKGTIEEKISQLQLTKKELSQSLLNGENLSLGQLNIDDVLELIRT